jgi:hypothetical protein
METQFGAFSDHFVYSTPQSGGLGFLLLSTVSKLVIDLLHVGFLTRGALVVGDLYHRDNVIFGPALIEAFNIERGEAFYPRILLSEPVIKELSEYDMRDLGPVVVTDLTGRLVMNPFPLPFTGGEDGFLESFVRLNFHFADIKQIIDRSISKLESEGRHVHAEKWRYMQRLIGGPVLEAEPRLRRHW